MTPPPVGTEVEVNGERATVVALRWPSSLLVAFPGRLPEVVYEWTVPDA